MATHVASAAGHTVAGIAGVFGLLLLVGCGDDQPSAPSATPAFNTSTTTIMHPVEAKVQSAQCPVDGTTVTWVKKDTGDRFFMEVVRNIATGQVPAGEYIMHWRPILYSTVVADPKALALAPFADGVATQPTPLATNPFCVASIYTVNNNGNNSNRIPLTVENYEDALAQQLINVSGYTKLLPMSLGSPGASLTGRLRDEKGNLIGLDEARNVFRIEPWLDGVGPFGCAVDNVNPKGGCNLLQGILESVGTVNAAGEFEFGATPDTDSRDRVLELKSPKKGKVYFKPFRVTGGQPVDLDLFEEDQRAFLHYITEERDAGSVPDLLAGTAGWTIVRGKTSDNYQVAHSWMTDGVGHFTLNLTTDPGTTKTKSYAVQVQCDGSSTDLRMCTLVSAPRGLKVTVGGGGRRGEGTVIITTTLSGSSEVCSSLTAHPSAGGTIVDRAPDAGCTSAVKSAGDGNTWAVPF